MTVFDKTKERKKEQRDNNEDTRYSKHIPFDQKYNIRNMSSGLYSIIDLGRKYEEDKCIIPAYQRELVWSLENKQNLIFSIMIGSPIGEFIFNKKEIENGHDYSVEWTVIDGQQRIDALRGFTDNIFADKDGRFFKDYSYREMSYLVERFSNFSAFFIEDLSEKEQIEVYLAKNTGGVIHTKEELEKARKYLANLSE